jgi:hypothetical protein
MAKIVSITPTGQWQDLFKLKSVSTTETSELRLQNHKPHLTVGDEVEYTKNEKGTIKIQRPNNLVDLVEVSEAALPIPRKYRVTNAPLPSSAKLPSRQQ